MFIHSEPPIRAHFGPLSQCACTLTDMCVRVDPPVCTSACMCEVTACPCGVLAAAWCSAE